MIDHTRITETDLIIMTSHAFQIRVAADRLRMLGRKMRREQLVTRDDTAEIDHQLREIQGLFTNLRSRFPEVSHADPPTDDPPPTALQQDRRRMNKLVNT